MANASFPIRDDDHHLEELSVRFLQRFLPEKWYVDKPDHDYGADLRISIVQSDGHVTGLELLVQLKASFKATDGDSETATLKTSTYNFLKRNLAVVMLVKYVDAEKEAYWILLREIPPPDQGNATFTVRFPKTNRIRSINWRRIAEIVTAVTDGKLEANQD